MYYTRFCYSNNINILYTISIIHVFILQYDISVYNIKIEEKVPPAPRGSGRLYVQAIYLARTMCIFVCNSCILSIYIALSTSERYVKI